MTFQTKCIIINSLCGILKYTNMYWLRKFSSKCQINISLKAGIAWFKKSDSDVRSCNEMDIFIKTDTGNIFVVCGSHIYLWRRWKRSIFGGVYSFSAYSMGNWKYQNYNISVLCWTQCSGWLELFLSLHVHVSFFPSFILSLFIPFFLSSFLCVHILKIYVKKKTASLVECRLYTK